jgi:hypothetical protein
MTRNTRRQRPTAGGLSAQDLLVAITRAGNVNVDGVELTRVDPLIRRVDVGVIQSVDTGDRASRQRHLRYSVDLHVEACVSQAVDGVRGRRSRGGGLRRRSKAQNAGGQSAGDDCSKSKLLHCVAFLFDFSHVRAVALGAVGARLRSVLAVALAVQLQKPKAA